MKCPLPPASRVWAYTRASPGEEQSVGDQNRAVDEYCRENGLALEKLFCDDNRAGSSTATRDQFQAMIGLARSMPQERLPDGLILWSFSRFAREFDDAQFYKADLRRRGIVLVSISDEIPANAHGRLIEAVVDWNNAQFLEQLRRDVKRGLHDVARQGYAPGGFPPAGYLAEKIQIGTKRNGEPRFASYWIPDPEKAPLVLRAWEMRAQGSSYTEIREATRLFRADNSFSSMFRNKTYLGVRKCGDLEIEDAHEALITPELWDTVQETLIDKPKRGERWPKGKPHPRSVHSPFLLSGLVYCAYCGSAMCGSHDNVRTRPNAWPYYLCGRKSRQGWDSCQGRKVGARPVEAATLEAVLTHVLTPTFVEELIEEVNVYLAGDLGGLDGMIEDTKRQLVEVERAIGNLLDLAETFGARAAAARLLEREAEEERLRRELRGLELRRQQSHVEVSPQTVFAIIAEARDGLNADDVAVKRALLGRFVDRVEVGNETGTLVYTFPLNDLFPGFYMVPPRGFEPLSRA